MNRTNGARPKLVSAIGTLMLAASALCVLVPAADAQNAGSRNIIANVHILGTRNIPTDKVMTFIRSKPGTEFSQAAVQNDISALAASRLFKSIRDVRTNPTADGRLDLYFEVVEHPNIVRDIVYKHAKHVKQNDLEGMTRVRRGMPLDVELNSLARFEIQEHLKKEGYYFANVTLEEGYDDRHDRVVFNINEGPLVRVRHVEFTGQKELASAARLRTQIDTSRSFLQTWGGKFNPAMIDNDVIKLEEYYRSNGYLNAVVSRELRFSDDFRFVDIVFHVQENGRYRIADVRLDGIAKDFSHEQLTSVLTAKQGEFYNENVVTGDVKNLTDYAGWRGYPLEVRKIVTEIPESPGTVRVQYEVRDMPQSYVGEIIIVGNTVTQDRVIRRMLGFYPGQVLRYPELRQAERDLARLNIFKMNPELGIRPTVTVLDNPSPFKDILVKVDEDRTGSLMIGAGLNSDSGIVGSVVLNERNFDLFRFPTSWADFYEGKAFRGAGQELRIEAMPGTQVQRYSASIREPYLFDRPYSLLTSVYYRDRIFDEYTENRLGLRLNLSHQFTKEWGASVGVRAENVGVSNIAFGAPADYTDAYGHNTVIAPSVSVFWDTRDSFLRPTEGGKVEFSYEQAFGTNTFPIFNVEASRYFTLWQRPDGSGKHVLALRSQLSYAGSNTPVYERFFGGGFQNIRGFEFRGVGPNVNGFMVGGQFQFLNSAEYQIPIRANDRIYFVAFLDSGTVESKFGIHDYRVSAGVGLRLSIPMLGPVPLAFDFGIPIIRADSDRRQIFAFGVGIYR
jgi:outer membrane protein assembly complex protein YaeT